ncbi:MAG TPA: FecR domain-containing protein [Moraxellaceae bacterium]
MRNKPMQLNTRGLIAAAIAGSASAYAVAEQAGRVNFVTGDVKATAADGSVRSLARGDLINSGDKISTGSGRLQLRFTDGGFVSLQPNTVFGVDQYLYANKAPEETSLFFSLLQGGMRTITGAIGKVNKQSYKVRTPVATIGIRGTEYLARVNPNRVIVSVGSGFVNVSNDAGNITGGAGQNIEALQGYSPRLTSDEPDLNATGPEGEREQYAADDSEESRQQRMGDQVNIDNNNVVLANGSPPVYTYVEQPSGLALPNGSGYNLQIAGINGSVVSIPGLTATFDPNTGAITSLVQTTNETSPPLGNQALAAATVPTGPSYGPGTLKFVNVGRYGSIGWGEITDGLAEFNTLNSNLPVSATSNQFYGYMMVTPTVGYTGGKASYSLRGASLARLNNSSDSGKLDHLNLDLNLLLGTASVDMLVKMENAAIGDLQVSESNIYMSPSSSTSFNLYALGTTSSTSYCSNASGCYTDISGLFAAGGSEVAASYLIRTGTGSNKITGFAALGQDKYTPQIDNVIIATPEGEAPFAGSTVIQNADGTLAAAYIPSVCTSGDGVTCNSDSFDPGTLQFVNTGHSGDLYWGEMTDGEGSSSGYPNQAFYPSLGTDQFQAYIMGKASPVVPLGTATYSLISPSSGTARLGNTGLGLTAQLQSFDLTLRLDLGQLDLSMSVLLSGEGTQTVSVTGQNVLLPLVDGDGNYAAGFGLNSSQLKTTSTGFFCSSGCDTNINGFFTDNGTKIGATYNINSYDYGNLFGVAALGITGAPNSSATRPLTSGPNYVFLATDGNSILGTQNYTPTPLNNTGDYYYSENEFDSQGRLVSATTKGHINNGEGFDDLDHVVLAVDTSAGADTTYTDTGTHKYLHWGRVTGSNITYDGETQTISSPGIDYITGVMTDPSSWNKLNTDYKGGSATYVAVGGTAPTDLQGHAGQLDKVTSIMTLHLNDLPTLDVALGLNNVNGRNYTMSSTGNTLSNTSTTFGVEFSSITGCASSCSASASGFFVGPQAEGAALAYSLTGNVDSFTSSNTIKGVAAFERGGISSGNTAP